MKHSIGLMFLTPAVINPLNTSRTKVLVLNGNYINFV